MSRDGLNAKALKIVEELEKIGFPNRGSIQKMVSLADQLLLLQPDFKPAEQLSIKQIDQALQKIKSLLKKDEKIPVPFYTALYAQLIIFKENLISSINLDEQAL